MFLELLDTSEKLMDCAVATSEAENIFPHKKITRVGNSAHIVIPRKYADEKFNALVIIRKNKDEIKKRR